MYLLFAFDTYYPAGGWHDYKGLFDTLQEAKEAGLRCGIDIFQIVSLEKLELVYLERTRRL